MSHVKEYTLNKKYKVMVRFGDSEDVTCIMSYNDYNLAVICTIALTDDICDAWISE